MMIPAEPIWVIIMKVAIVGAGIVGTYLAWRLAGKGADVSVFERKKEIGGKACSGLISKRLWHFFPEEKGLVENEIKSANIHFPKKDVEIRFSPHMLVIDRKGLEEYAAELARKAGAKIFLGMNVANVLHAKGKKPQVVLEKNGKKAFLEFDCIVGCDGEHSVVRKSLRLREPRMRLGILAYGKAKKNQQKDAVEVFPTKNGFGWIIPRGAGEAEYGTLEKPADAKKQFEMFCRRQKARPRKVLAAVVPEGLRIPDNSRIALCGDAAGLTKSWSGGGVVWGLTAAHMLARDFPNLAKYEKQMKRFFAPRMFFGRIETKAAAWLGLNMPALLPKKIRIDSDWGI